MKRTLLLLLLIFASQLEAAKRPNIILFLVDDMGWTDLGCYGSDLYETPNIDRLADEGIRFRRAYAACTVCSPTRAAILTGMYPARLHVTDFIAGHPFHNTKLRIPDWTKQLNVEHVTIAEELKRLDYKTAHIGKWHLTPRDGVEHPDLWPEAQGFDKNIGGFSAGAPGSYHWPYGRGRDKQQGKVINLPNKGKQGDYLTDTLTDEAVKIIQEWKDDPFFIYFSYYNVHTPLQAKAEYVKEFEGKVKNGARHTNPTYAAMIRSLDESVGRVLNQLENHGLSDDTIIMFTADNGGLIEQGNKVRVTSNLPVRNGKGSVYEGGVRVPGIIKWPGVVTGGQVNSFPIISMDFLPTILDIVEIKPTNRPDGISLTKLLRGQSIDRRSELFWHYPHYHSMGGVPYTAMLSGNHRLIHFHEDDRLEFYDIANDPHENTNLASSRPQLAKHFLSRMNAWRKRVDAQM
ncbi:MAG: sulfatase, partial [Limisphaerales bacterium]